MAVPGSGQLNMLKLAREKVYDDYNSGSGITAPISMYDLVNGGNTNGSGVSYDDTNFGSSSHPDLDTPHAFSEWYSYDHDAAVLGGNGTDWHSSSYYASGSIYYTSNGTSNLGHTSQTNACADTTLEGTCSSIMWRGTLGNGKTLYFQYGNSIIPLAVLDGSNFSWMRLDSTWYNHTISGGTSTQTGSSTGNDAVFQVNSSGVVSNFTACNPLTSYSSSVVGVFNANCNFNGTLNTMNQTYYHDGSGTYPTAGDICYSDSAGTSVLAAGYYTIPPSSSGVGNRTVIKISTQGIVDTSWPQTC
jgi:hypothetical protein